MSMTPHQVQRTLDIQIDTADFTLYVKTPSLRNNRWVPATLRFLIQLSAKRHQWRVEITEELKRINGDEDE